MKLAAAVLLAVIVLVSSTSAEALSIVNAEAILDWTGFTFTTTGTLAVSLIDQPRISVSTWYTPTTPTTTTGSASAEASAVNGYLTAAAGAQTIADGGLPNVGEASAFVSETFWLYGTGTGSLVVTVPYHLALTSLEADERDLTHAAAGVNFVIGPGVSGVDYVWDAITLDGAGSISRDGILTAASREFSNPTWGPLVSLSGTTHVYASSALPEDTSSVLLLVLGLLVIGAFRWRRSGVTPSTLTAAR
jgi:hypothetical protein